MSPPVVPSWLSGAEYAPGVPLRVRQTPRARRYRVAVGLEGVTVTIPRRGTLHEAESFLARQAGWVSHRLAEWASRRDALPPPGFLRLRGNLRPVRLEPAAGARSRVHDTGSEILVLAPRSCLQAAERALEAWLRNVALQMLRDRVAFWSTTMGVTPTDLTLRGQTSRWGSCSSTGRLSFNWRIILEPHAALEYLVIHELAHLRELNHGPRFWALVATHCPDHREQSRKLDHESIPLRAPWICWPE